MLAFASLSGIDRVSQKLRKEVSGNLAVLVINEHGPVPVQWSPLKRTKWQLSTGVKRQNRSRNQRLRQLSLPFRCKDTGQLSRTKVGQSLGVDLILFTYLSGRGKLKWVFREQRERQCVPLRAFKWLQLWLAGRLSGQQIYLLFPSPPIAHKSLWRYLLPGQGSSHKNISNTQRHMCELNFRGRHIFDMLV